MTNKPIYEYGSEACPGTAKPHHSEKCPSTKVVSPRTVRPLTEREELLVAYGHIISARSLQVDGVGRLMLALDRLPPSERGNLHALAEGADEAMRRLRMAMARLLEI